MIENQIHSRIESVTDRVFPTQPADNIPLPFVVYTVTDSEPQRTLQGSGTLIRHAVTIESSAETLAKATTLLSSVKAQLDGYQGGQIHRAFFNTQDTAEEENGYHGTATYTVWMTTANITPTSDNNSVIRTGNDFIELETCDHTLRLDCDGLSLDDAEIVIDLSNYARLDSENTFSADQTIEGTVTATSFVGDGSELTGLPAPDLSTYARKDQSNTFTADQTVTGVVTATTGFAGNLFKPTGDVYVTSNDGGVYITGVSAGFNTTSDIILTTAANIYLAGAVQIFGSITGISGQPASIISSGTFNVNRMPSTVARRDQANTFTATNTFSGQIRTNQTSAHTTAGTKVARMPIYDVAGTLVGYIPIMDQ